MNRPIISSILCTMLSLLFAIPCAATNTVFSGLFRGDEPQATGLDDICGGVVNGQHSTAYYLSPPLYAGETGRYLVDSAYQYVGGGHSVAIYRGEFDPAQPSKNRLRRTSFAAWLLGDDPLVVNVSLQAGEPYRMVVSTTCGSPPTTHWAITFSGPGEITGGEPERVSDLPVFTAGHITSADPGPYAGCGYGNYRQSGPTYVRESTYYFIDVSQWFANSVCMEVHSGPLDPEHPEATLIARFIEGDYWDNPAVIHLPTGTYYFITQLQDEQDAVPGGEYFYLLVPSADSPFAIQPTLSGSWYDPETPGQGFFMDVLSGSNRVFLGWFTYGLEQPLPGADSGPGDPGQRWLTAQGPYQGSSANLEISSTSGGIFDAFPPVPDARSAGRMTLRFEDCTHGEVSYELDDAGRQGTIPIRRVEEQPAGVCRQPQGVEGPGRPGPLF